MIEAISHLIHRDYEAIVQDFITLRFIPKGEPHLYAGLHLLLYPCSHTLYMPYVLLLKILSLMMCRYRFEAHPACLGKGL